MLSFEKQYTIQSITKKDDGSLRYPGVSYTVKRLSFVERGNRDLGMAEALEELDAISKEYKTLPKDKNEGKKDDEGNDLEPDYSEDTLEQAKRRSVLDTRYTRIRDTKVIPAVIKFGLISVQGVEGTVDELLATADREFLREAYAFCEAASQLSAEQLKNLASPGTSQGAVAGQSENSTATTAAKSDS